MTSMSARLHCVMLALSVDVSLMLESGCAVFSDIGATGSDVIKIVEEMACDVIIFVEELACDVIRGSTSSRWPPVLPVLLPSNTLVLEALLDIEGTCSNVGQLAHWLDRGAP